MQEYIIHPLVVGANETDQGVMTYLKGYGKRIWLPIYVFYLEGGKEKILVDTGLEQFMVPPEVGEQYGLHIQEFEDALGTYGLTPEDIDIVSTHATGTSSGDIQEAVALRQVWNGSGRTLLNNTKSFIGHAMGAAGALELAGNLPAFDDRVCHATINLDRVDPECAMPGLVANQPRDMDRVDKILNNSFGMLGINSAVIVSKV